MALILNQQVTGDGYDVQVLLRNGESRAFHFLERPENVQEKVNAMEDTILVQSTLKEAKENAQARLDVWYQEQLSAGVSAGDMVLKTTTYDQSRLATLATGVNTGIITQQLQTTDPLPSPVWDIDGVAHQMTVGEFLAVVLEYMAAVGAIEAKYSTFASSIATATSADELDALVFA